MFFVVVVDCQSDKVGFEEAFYCDVADFVLVKSPHTYILKFIT